MSSIRTSYSPYVLIYLDVEGRRIYLADLLYNSATLVERALVPAQTVASLVLSIDGIEKREEIILDQGIEMEDSVIQFTYTDTSRINGRHFPL